MAFKSISGIIDTDARQTSSDDSGKKAIDVCVSAWNSAHDERNEDEDSSDWDCQKAGNEAYLKAVPPLSGYKNICDFIACINYASIIGVIAHNEATHYLGNAKIALSATYHNPNHIHERDRRKSRKKKNK
jgi:hypothetical protein